VSIAVSSRSAIQTVIGACAAAPDAARYEGEALLHRPAGLIGGPSRLAEVGLARACRHGCRSPAAPPRMASQGAPRGSAGCGGPGFRVLHGPMAKTARSGPVPSDAGAVLGPGCFGSAGGHGQAGDEGRLRRRRNYPRSPSGGSGAELEADLNSLLAGLERTLAIPCSSSRPTLGYSWKSGKRHRPPLPAGGPCREAAPLRSPSGGGSKGVIGAGTSMCGARGAGQAPQSNVASVVWVNLLRGRLVRLQNQNTPLGL